MITHFFSPYLLYSHLSYKYSQLDPRPPTITAHYSDVADPQSVEECLSEIVYKHGKIDNLVRCTYRSFYLES